MPDVDSPLSLLGTPYEDAEYVLFGVPFDATCTFRKGTRHGPKGIREALFDFEVYVFDYKLDLSEVPMHDAGDLPVDGLSSSEMVEIVHKFSKKVVKDGKFPILIGGEHSTSPGCVTAFDDIAVLGIDAHSDYRQDWKGDKNNHACAMKRIADKFGEENVMWIGVRSFEGPEHESSAKILDSLTILKNGIDWTIAQIRKELPNKRLYITLDIDGIDPAYAPGTGTPEPYGLAPLDVKKIIDTFAPNMVGFDLVEVSPPLDNGLTAVLGAKLITNVIAATYTAKKNRR
jgi:agmatinase